MLWHHAQKSIWFSAMPHWRSLPDNQNTGEYRMIFRFFCKISDSYQEIPYRLLAICLVILKDKKKERFTDPHSGRIGRAPECVALPDNNRSFHLGICGISEFIRAGCFAKVVIELSAIHQLCRCELTRAVTGCFYDMDTRVVIYPGNHRARENSEGIGIILVILDMDDQLSCR